MSIPRLPEWLWLLGLAALSASAGAAPAADAAQRERIATQRAVIERDAQAAQKACTQQFAVTDCIDRAKAERRQRMQPLDRELAVLDDESRRRRAADRLAQIRQRQMANANQRPEVSVRSRKPAASEPAPTASAPVRAAEAVVAARQAAASQAEAEAGRRAAASAQRAAQAQAHRAAVEQRNRERARQGRPAEPLPPPPAASR